MEVQGESDKSNKSAKGAMANGPAEEVQNTTLQTAAESPSNKEGQVDTEQGSLEPNASPRADNSTQLEASAVKQAEDEPSPLPVEKEESGAANPTSHIRTGSKVEVIEAPNRGPPQTSVNGTLDHANAGHPSPAPVSPSLRPDLAQHRHDSRSDKPSAYQPSPPRSYLHLRAVAVQLPNNVASTSNATFSDPPTIILEGRTNLSSARRSFYPKVTRTLPELHLWLLALTLSFPASIFSPFTYPPPTLTQGPSASDAAIRNYLVTITNQLGRILVKPYVLSHPATVALVECDFNYSPSLPHIGPGSSPLALRKMEEGVRLARAGFDPLRGKKGKGSGMSVTSTWDADGVAAALGLPNSLFAGSSDAATTSSLPSRNPLSLFTRASASPQRISIPPPVALPPGEEDEDEEDLTLARNEITRLEMQFDKASQAAQQVVDKSGALNATLSQLTQALEHLEQLDSGRLIAKRSREEELTKLVVRGIEGWSAAEAGVSATNTSTIVPSMSYQSYNARMAIDALLRRAAAATHRHSALVVLVQKRREAERLKRARGEIRQEEVDWVLTELKDAQRTTNILTHHLATFTATLKDELKDHSRVTHGEIQSALLSHARNSIRAHKFMLSSLSKARDDLLAKKEGRAVHAESTSATRTLRGPTPIEATVEEEHVTPAKEEQSLSQNEHVAIAPTIQKEGELRQEEGVSPIGGPKIKSANDGRSLPAASPLDDNVGNKREETKETTSKSLQEEQEPEENRLSAAVLDKAPSPLQEEGTPHVETNSAPLLVAEDVKVDNLGAIAVTQSGFLPPRQPHPVESANMSQSAFLPTRDMDRYANPFARLDPSLPAQAQLPRPGTSVITPQGHPNGAPSDRPAVKDVWASRNRLSASEAARSLAGRF